MNKYTCTNCGHVKYEKDDEILSSSRCNECNSLKFGLLTKEWIPCGYRPENVNVVLPIGTRIVFIRDLTSGPDDHGPGNVYAMRGDIGEVLGYDCIEGHFVKRDSWPAGFGANYAMEFIQHDVQPVKQKT